MQWCNCNRTTNDPFHRANEFGDAMACSRCGGLIECDFCRLDYHRIGKSPLSFAVIGGKFVCPQHVWLAGVERLSSE